MGANYGDIVTPRLIAFLAVFLRLKTRIARSAALLHPPKKVLERSIKVANGGLQGGGVDLAEPIERLLELRHIIRASDVIHRFPPLFPHLSTQSEVMVEHKAAAT